jgi:hypothetical protein
VDGHTLTKKGMSTRFATGDTQTRSALRGEGPIPVELVIGDANQVEETEQWAKVVKFASIKPE